MRLLFASRCKGTASFLLGACVLCQGSPLIFHAVTPINHQAERPRLRFFLFYRICFKQLFFKLLKSLSGKGGFGVRYWDVGTYKTAANSPRGRLHGSPLQLVRGEEWGGLNTLGFEP